MISYIAYTIFKNDHVIVVDICEAMKGLMEESKAEGEAKGKVEGEAHMSQLVRILLEQHKTDELYKVTLDENFGK